MRTICSSHHVNSWHAESNCRRRCCTRARMERKSCGAHSRHAGSHEPNGFESDVSSCARRTPLNQLIHHTFALGRCRPCHAAVQELHNHKHNVQCAAYRRDVHIKLRPADAAAEAVDEVSALQCSERTSAGRRDLVHGPWSASR